MVLASITLVLTFEDASGSRASTQLHLKSGTTVAEADAALPGVVSAFASISSASLVGVRYIYKVVQVPKPVSDGGEPNLHTGVFTFTTDTNGEYGLIELPALKIDFVEDTGPCAGHCIMLAGAEVVDFLAALSASGASNPFAHVLDVVSAAYIQSRV